MLISCDAAGLEWRTAVWLSKDPIGIKEINDKADTHSNNQELFGLPSRLIAKRYLFRTIFRGSGWAFANDPDFMEVSDDPKFWDDINEKFYKKYKGLNQWHYQLATLVASRKLIITPFGREYLILPMEDGKLPWTQFTNYPVQGSGADLMMIARVSLKNRMRKMKLRSLLVSTVHDSLVTDSPDDEIKTITSVMHSVFDDLPKNVKRLFGINLPIPFPCETKMGSNLLEMS